MFEIRYTEINSRLIPALKTIRTSSKIDAYATAQSLAYTLQSQNSKYSVSIYQYGPTNHPIKIATITKGEI